VFFDIHQLERRKIRFDEAFGPGSIDLLDRGLTQVGELHAAGAAELVDPSGAREIRIRGQIAGEMEVGCARCLQPTRVPISRAVDLFYRPMAAIAREEEMAINDAETEIAFYEGNGVELADVVREQILVALPIRNVCREDCQGICPSCGKNRNVEACRCREDFSDPRWEALRNWRQ